MTQTPTPAVPAPERRAIAPWAMGCCAALIVLAVASVLPPVREVLGIARGGSAGAVRQASDTLLCLPVLGVVRALSRWRDADPTRFVRGGLAWWLLLFAPVLSIFLWPLLLAGCLVLVLRPHLLRDAVAGAAIVVVAVVAGATTWWELAWGTLVVGAWLIVSALVELVLPRLGRGVAAAVGIGRVLLGSAILGLLLMIPELAWGFFVVDEGVSRDAVGAILALRVLVASSCVLVPLFQPVIDGRAPTRLPFALHLAFAGAMAPMLWLLPDRGSFTFTFAAMVAVIVALSGWARRLDGFAAVLVVVSAFGLADHLGGPSVFACWSLAVALSLRSAPRARAASTT